MGWDSCSRVTVWAGAVNYIEWICLARDGGGWVGILVLMSPATIEKRLREARELLSDEDFGAALARFEELTRLRPDSAAVWLGMALLRPA